MRLFNEYLLSVALGYAGGWGLGVLPQDTQSSVEGDTDYGSVSPVHEGGGGH